MIQMLLIALLLPSLATAADPADFSTRFALSPDGNATLQHMELPLEVLQASRRKDGGDIRVFNADGQEAPMLIRVAGILTRTPEELPLPLFPVANRRDGGDDLRIEVRTATSGTVVEVQRPQSASQTDPDLLLDASTAPALAALHFIVSADTDTLIPVTVRGSDDLVAWHPVASGVVLRREHLHGRIEQDTVPLSGRAWKYYLVQGPGLASRVAGVNGISRPEVPPPARRWLPLDAVRVGDGQYECTVPEGLPVDSLDLDGDGSAVAGLTVLVPTSAGGWREAAHGVLFRLREEGQTIAGAPMQMHALPGRFRILVQGAWTPLRIGWIARELLFLPQGPGPFTLAVGNAAVPASPDLLSPLLRASGTASPGLGQAALGPPTRQANPVGPGKKTVLWAILGLGVALLGAMAWRLARGMRRDTEM